MGGGGGPARTALRTLRANAECAYIGFHLYCFPFCHLLILWLKCFPRETGPSNKLFLNIDGAVEVEKRHLKLETPCKIWDLLPDVFKKYELRTTH